MHCWRHKTPIIYRATSQWFAGMDVTPQDGGKTLRETALEGVDATAFYPSWGKQRLFSMIANRPDWTLSRQRQWGVPMAFFVHKETGELHPRTLELLEEVAKRVEQSGIEAWQSLDPRELIGDDANLYEKNRDTLDVWFDSGTTHWHVLRGSHKDQLQFPADLYLEGSDQHRGWFHSSLLTASMIDGRAPYKGLLTHGFTVDGEGRKMSKSLGNGIDPHEVANRLGAEIIRLWIASTDYSGELAISEEILKRVTEGYRRIRNTLRFLLANLSDFDFARHAVPVDEWLEIDRYAVAFSQQLQTELLGHYEKYEFHPVVAKLQTYCSEDLGGFYLDVLKDRLYTSAADSRAPLRADRAVPPDARPAARARAVPVVHRGRSVEGVPAGERHDLHGNLLCVSGSRRLGRADREVGAAARRARQRDEGARGSAHREPHRFVAAGRSHRPCERCALRRADEPRRRPEVRADHVGRDGRQGRRRSAGKRRRGRVEVPEVRALLALPRRCRRARRASDAVRPLLLEPV